MKLQTLRPTACAHGVGRCLISGSLAAALVAAAALPAQAASQSRSFSTTYQQSSFGLGTLSLYPPAPQFSVQPFDSSLGTLTSATIRWASGSKGTVTVAPGTGGGAWGIEFGGAVSVNGFQYNGYGGGDGWGAGPGQSFSVLLPGSGRSDTFTDADASVWGAFTGASPYTIAYLGSYSGSSPYRITATNISGGLAEVISEADVTYTYIPDTPPSAPGPLALLGAIAGWRTSRRLRRSATDRCRRGQ
jgi:hypothetical protein